MIKFHRFSLVATILFVASIPALAATVGSRFDPNDYASNGALTLVDGDVLEFNTNAGTFKSSSF